MASSAAGWRWRDFPAAVSRSRTTSDFDSFRRRDSASIWATRASGNRTVSVLIAPLYYNTDVHPIHQPCNSSPLRHPRRHMILFRQTERDAVHGRAGAIIGTEGHGPTRTVPRQLKAT